jgi:hypothetical protein
MKERTDKRDFLTLAASISGFKVEWLDGVRPDDLNPKAMPDVRFPFNKFQTIFSCFLRVWTPHA